MKRSEIIQEARDRGYHYVSQSRLDLWAQQSYDEICSREAWPFLRTVATGTAPLALEDLRQVRYVNTGTDTVDGKDLRDILDLGPDLDRSGDPEYWYVENGVLHVWPTTEEEITVRYQRRPPLWGAESEPLIPLEYQELIIDGIVLRGLKDNDEYEAAASLQAVIDGRVEDMKQALIRTNLQNPDTLVQTRGWGGYDV